MKKATSFILLVATVASLIACGGENPSEVGTATDGVTPPRFY